MQIVSQTLDSFLTTNITQEHTTYNPATTYILEADDSLTNASMVEYGNYNYRSLTNANTGNDPHKMGKMVSISKTRNARYFINNKNNKNSR